MDSTFCKVHQHASDARKIFGNQNIGVSRGGKTTKIHDLVNEHFQFIGVDLTEGNVHDSEVTIRLLSKVTLEGKKVLADKAFCSEEIRKYISQEKAVTCISDKSNAVNLHVQRIKNFRQIATRYDKLPDCFLNFVFLDSVMI